MLILLLPVLIAWFHYFANMISAGMPFVPNSGGIGNWISTIHSFLTGSSLAMYVSKIRTALEYVNYFIPLDALQPLIFIALLFWVMRIAFAIFRLIIDIL